MNLGEAILSRKVVRIKVKTPKKPRKSRRLIGYRRPTPTIDRVVRLIGDRSTTADVAMELEITHNAAYVHLLRAEKAGRAERWKEGRFTFWRAIK